jgi:hypothetical protein
VTRHQLPTLLLTAMMLAALSGLTGCAGGSPAVSDRGLTACFHDFTDLYQERIYQVLKNAPGVDRIERLWPGDCGRAESCLCYRLDYNGPIEELTSWLRKNLPLNKAVPFHCVTRGAHRLEVIFDAGFK